MTINLDGRTIFGNKKIVFGTYDANGSANGTLVTGLTNIQVVFISNSENTSECPRIVENSNNGTIGSVSGSIYIAVADSTNNTGSWMAIGT